MTDQHQQLTSQNLEQQNAAVAAAQQSVAQAAQGVAATAGAAGAISESSEELACQWAECNEKFPNAERLYDHVCDQHIGRKSTNNLNLTCAWGNCQTKVVKRDHITSHMRVHVPLKPHRCPRCGKTFKRPQDLKKHVKTHADDSGMRGDGSNGGVRGNAFAPIAPQGRGHPGGYYGDASMQGVGAMPYNFQTSAPAHGGYYGQATSQGAAGYGPVYYGVNTPSGHGQNGFSTMDNFFRAAKGREFDPGNYQQVSQQLMGMQGMQLPQPHDMSMVHGMHQENVMGGNSGGVYTATAHHPAPFGFDSLRTKSDLTQLDALLREMRNTAYDHAPGPQHQPMPAPGSMPASDAGRSSHSPSSASFAHAPQTAMRPHGQSPTPSLTPGSSVNSHSHSTAHSPAQTIAQHAQHVTQSMYPTLPTTSAPSTHMGSNVTLGSHFMHEPQQRRGGYLGRAQPAPGELAQSSRSEDTEMKSPTEKAPSHRKSKPSDLNIDPALSGSASAGGPMSEGSATPTTSTDDPTWLHTITTLEQMQRYVETRLERGEYEASPDPTERFLKREEDISMKDEPSEEGIKAGSAFDKASQTLYPVLKI